MKRTKIIAAVLTVSVLMVGVAVGVILLQSNQTYYNRAAIPVGEGRVWVEPSGGEMMIGDRQRIDVYFTSGEGSSAHPISAITLRMVINNLDNAVDIVDENGNPAGMVINQNLLISGEFASPINQYTQDGGQIIMDIAVVNTTITGYKASSPQVLGSFYIEAKNEGMVNLSFDNVESKMLTKADPPSDILQNPDSVSFNIVVDNQPPDVVGDFSLIDFTLTNVSFQWTTPNDLGPTNAPGGSVIVFNTQPITNDNWDDSTLLGEFQNNTIPGTLETMSFDYNFSRDTAYYFAIKTFDNYGNYSEISNIINAKPTAPDSTLDFGFSLQGLNNYLDLIIEASVDFVMPSGDVFSYLVNVSQSTWNDFYPVNKIIVNDMTPGTPRFSVKVPNYLRKSWNTISLNYGDNMAEGIPVLIAGDFNGDNRLDITDIGMILSTYTQLRVPVDSSNQKYDINKNGEIDITDIAVVLSNYTELVVHGDQI